MKKILLHLMVICVWQANAQIPISGTVSAPAGTAITMHCNGNDLSITVPGGNKKTPKEVMSEGQP